MSERVYCPTCRNTVAKDYPHSCYDAAKVIAVQDAEKAVVKAAERFDAAWEIASVTDEGLGLPPLLRCVPEIRSLCEAVRALRAARGEG